MRAMETLTPARGRFLSSKIWPLKAAGPSWAGLAWMRKLALPNKSLAVLTLPFSFFKAWALMRMVPSVEPMRGRRATRPFLSVLKVMRWAALPLSASAAAPVVSGKLASPSSTVKTTGTPDRTLSNTSRTTADRSSSGWALVSAIWLVPRSALMRATAPR